MRSIISCLIIHLFLTGCASVGRSSFDEIMYFEEIDSVPEHRVISVCECYGFSGFFKIPTFESAVKEAKSKAVRKGGNAIIYMHSIRAVDLPDDDTIDIVSLFIKSGAFIRGSDTMWKAADSWEKLEEADEQLVWFFKIVELER